jgi:hypothetical protein
MFLEENRVASFKKWPFSARSKCSAKKVSFGVLRFAAGGCSLHVWMESGFARLALTRKNRWPWLASTSVALTRAKTMSNASCAARNSTAGTPKTTRCTPERLSFVFGVISHVSCRKEHKKHSALCPFLSLDIEDNRLKTFATWDQGISAYAPAEVRLRACLPACMALLNCASAHPLGEQDRLNT